MSIAEPPSSLPRGYPELLFPWLADVAGIPAYEWHKHLPAELMRLLPTHKDLPPMREEEESSEAGYPEPLYPWLYDVQGIPASEWHKHLSPELMKLLPTHKDLPETDGKPVENCYEFPQGNLLSSILRPHLDRMHPDGNYLLAADTGIYWSAAKAKLQGCKSPDWYYIPNVPKLLNGEFRGSYVLWEENECPVLVVEFVSGSGAKEHNKTLGRGKFWVYEQAIKAQYYAIWDPFKDRLEIFELIDSRYESLTPDTHGRFRIPPMEIDLGIWDGDYGGVATRWLRAWDWNGVLLPTAEERETVVTQRAEVAMRLAAEEKRQSALEKQRAEAEKQRAEAEKQRADAEKQRADQLAAKLRELGVNPD